VFLHVSPDVFFSRVDSNPTFRRVVSDFVENPQRDRIFFYFSHVDADSVPELICSYLPGPHPEQGILFFLKHEPCALTGDVPFTDRCAFGLLNSTSIDLIARLTKDVLLPMCAGEAPSAKEQLARVGLAADVYLGRGRPVEAIPLDVVATKNFEERLMYYSKVSGGRQVPPYGRRWGDPGDREHYGVITLLLRTSGRR